MIRNAVKTAILSNIITILNNSFLNKIIFLIIIKKKVLLLNIFVETVIHCNSKV